MSIIRCKMCGGTLEITQGVSVAVCEYCGTQQTLPRLNSERKTALYDRASHFRRSNDFDKAMAVYELLLNEDIHDAETYWSIVLCRYGIEYVEDPRTHKRIPTVNRAQYTSILADEDYKQAIANADAAQREVYEREAHAIDEIQKGILEISGKEDPFDVFICYKETDEHGRRTPDSVYAQEIYNALTGAGYKVFFARITLEDKLGSAYEPYIFAALNSAKVMIALGTKPEYFNAVWVKNEWSRYLNLVKAGKGKTLIPAYRDMNPYDMPEDFAYLQSQDMGKLGYLQDLLRGIDKLIGSTSSKTAQTHSDGDAQVAPLLKRGFIFLEDENWARADECFEKALNINPECGEAYLGKLLSDLNLKREDALSDSSTVLEGQYNYDKALRFGDVELISRLRGYNAQIVARLTAEQQEKSYQDALSLKDSAKTEAHFLEALEILSTLGEYKDAPALALECKRMAEIENAKHKAQQKKTRRTVVISGSILACAALLIFLVIPGSFYLMGRMALNKGAFSRAIDQYAQAANLNITNGFLDAEYMAETGVYLEWGNASYSEKKYEEAAIAYQNAGKTEWSQKCFYLAGEDYLQKLEYDKAIFCYREADKYENAASQLKAAYYEKGLWLVAEKNFEEAIVAFKNAKAGDKANSTQLEWAQYCFDNGDFEKAYEISEEMVTTKHYKNARDLRDMSGYQWALQLEKSGEYEVALAVFEKLDYKDSASHTTFCRYEYACERLEDQDFKTAAELLSKALDYGDSKTKWQEAAYAYGTMCLEAKEYKTAAEHFKALGNYNDSKKLWQESQYAYACEMLTAKNYSLAADSFKELQNYNDSKDKMQEAMYEYVKKHKNNDDKTTYEYLKVLKTNGYKDSADIYKKLYTWVVKVTAINNNDDGSMKSTLSKYKNIYFDFKLTGGPPGESVNIRVTSTFPSGSSSSYTTEKMYDGSTGGGYSYYNTPNSAPAGKFTVSFYTPSGALIGSHTVTLTNS